ncbi:MAG: MurR/RpiR family transcriptional regulator [Anaerovoracaceae bacterium]
MSENENNSNALLQLQAHYNSLRASERKVADYILNYPDKIIYESIKALSEKANVSDTSVIRMCKAIGYNGYHDFKISVAQSIVAPQHQIHEEISDDDSISDILRKVMKANVKAIEDTMNFMDTQLIQQAVDAIANSNRLEFYGVGGSGSVAMDAQHKFFKYCNYCIAYSDPHMQAMSASTMKKGDVVVGISHSGNTKDTVDNLRIASNVGATTIAITGGLKSPITEVCSIVLPVVAKEKFYKPEPMSSRLAQLSIIDVLATGVAFTRPDDVLQSLQKTRESITSKRY